MTEPWGSLVLDAVPDALSRSIYHTSFLHYGGYDGQTYTVSQAPDCLSLRCLGPWSVILTCRQLRAAWHCGLTLVYTPHSLMIHVIWIKTRKTHLFSEWPQHVSHCLSQAEKLFMPIIHIILQCRALEVHKSHFQLSFMLICPEFPCNNEVGAGIQ